MQFRAGTRAEPWFVWCWRGGVVGREASRGGPDRGGGVWGVARWGSGESVIWGPRLAPARPLPALLANPVLPASLPMPVPAALSLPAVSLPAPPGPAGL